MPSPQTYVVTRRRGLLIFGIIRILPLACLRRRKQSRSKWLRTLREHAWKSEPRCRTEWMQALAAIGDRAGNQLMERDCDRNRNRMKIQMIFWICIYDRVCHLLYRSNENDHHLEMQWANEPHEQCEQISNKIEENAANAIGARTAMSAIEVATTQSETKTRIRRAFTLMVIALESFR